MKLLNLFKEFDFSLLEGNSFKEDSVREELIKPLLDSLGFSSNEDAQRKVLRSLSISHPFVTMGAGKERKITSIPDYVSPSPTEGFFFIFKRGMKGVC